MKKQICLFAAIVLMSTFFMASTARADDWGGRGNDWGNGNNGGNQGTQLPINNGIVFLTIAGIAIGIVAIKRSKLSAAAVKA